MRRIYLTVNNRVQHPDESPEDLGHLLIFDWDSKQLLGRKDVLGQWVVREGRSRGAKGMVWYHDLLWIATGTTVLAYNPDTLVPVFKHTLGRDLPGEYAGNHGLSVHNGRLYVVCTGLGQVAVFQGRELVDNYQVSGAVSEGNDYLHFNTLAHQPNTGKEFHIYHSLGVLFNYTDGAVAVSGLTGGPHGLLFVSETKVLICLSDRGELVEVDLSSGSLRVLFEVEVGHSNEWSKSGYLRGMDVYENSVFVASTDSIHKIPLVEEGFVEVLQYPEPIKAGAVYELRLDPRDW